MAEVTRVRSASASRLVEFLEPSVRKHAVPGAAIAFYRGGKVSTAAVGVLNVDTNVKATAESVFQIGSIGKVFTATLVMQLVEQGCLDLDAPLKSYLRDFAVADLDAAATVTLRQLLCHTSGIEGDFLIDSGRGDDCIARLQTMGTMLPQLFPPGECMSYCNFGYGMLGRVVEVVTGQTFDAAIRQRIFEPLEMAHSLTLAEDTLRFRCAIGHVPDPGRPNSQVPSPVIWAAQGLKGAGAGLSMSIGDLMSFVDLHLRGGRSKTVLRRASAVAMRRRQVRLPRFSEDGIDGWGLGWALFSWFGQRLIGHNGGAMGQSAFLRMLPEKKLAIALFSNGGESGSLYESMIKEIFEPLAGVESPCLPEATLEISSPQRYVGTYENLNGRFTVNNGENGLTIVFAAHPSLLPGPNIPPTALRFIDRNTARFVSGNPALDQIPIIFDTKGRDSAAHLRFALRVFPRLPD